MLGLLPGDSTQLPGGGGLIAQLRQATSPGPAFRLVFVFMESFQKVRFCKVVSTQPAGGGDGFRMAHPEHGSLWGPALMWVFVFMRLLLKIDCSNRETDSTHRLILRIKAAVGAGGIIRPGLDACF